MGNLPRTYVIVQNTNFYPFTGFINQCIFHQSTHRIIFKYIEFHMNMVSS